MAGHGASGADAAQRGARSAAAGRRRVSTHCCCCPSAPACCCCLAQRVMLALSCSLSAIDQPLEICLLGLTPLLVVASEVFDQVSLSLCAAGPTCRGRSWTRRPACCASPRSTRPTPTTPSSSVRLLSVCVCVRLLAPRLRPPPTLLLSGIMRHVSAPIPCRPFGALPVWEASVHSKAHWCDLCSP